MHRPVVRVDNILLAVYYHKNRLRRKAVITKSIAFEIVERPVRGFASRRVEQERDVPTPPHTPHLFVSHADNIVNLQTYTSFGSDKITRLVEGPGPYATIGAIIGHGLGLPRIPNRKAIASIWRPGRDFPPEFIDFLREYCGTTAYQARQDPHQPRDANMGFRTRARGARIWEQRDAGMPFSRVELGHWPRRLLKTTVVHMAKNLHDMEAEIRALAACHALSAEPLPYPQIIWEYQSDGNMHLPGRWHRLKQLILRRVSVFVIQWGDLITLIENRDDQPPGPRQRVANFVARKTQRYAEALTDSRTTIIVFCGKHGYLYYGGVHCYRWYPPCYHWDDVVNIRYNLSAFAGGFGVAYANGRGAVASMISGIVAESFCAEQCGLPRVRRSWSEKHAKKLRFNERDPERRAEEYLSRPDLEDRETLKERFYQTWIHKEKCV